MDTKLLLGWLVGACVVVGFVVLGGFLVNHGNYQSPSDQSVPATSAASQQSQQPVQQQSAAIDYGILGKPDATEYTDFDPDILKRSPAKSLARFRRNERHPPQGTIDHPINWDAIEEHADYERSLFYLAAAGVPHSITAQDWKWVRADEDALISESCGNAGDPGVLYPLPAKDCVGVK